MQLLKPSKPPAHRLMRLADQVSFGLFVVGTTMLPASAASGTTVWTKASEIMQDVYTQIVSISTITAVVCASVALLLMNFSKNGRTVDDSRAWLKRIVITWAILNGLGFIHHGLHHAVFLRRYLDARYPVTEAAHGNLRRHR